MSTFNLLGPKARQLYRNIISHPNLVWSLPMNEASGTLHDHCTRNNINSTSNNGNPTYGVSLGNGFVGKTYDGTGDYDGFGDVTALQFERTSPFSILCVVNPNISAAGSIVNKIALAGYPGWRLDFTAAGLLFLDLRNSAGRCMTQTNAAPTNGTATMILATYSGSSTVAGITFYKDGVTYADTDQNDTLSSGTIISTDPVTIGAFSNGGVALSATLGFLHFFNATLTAVDARRFAWLGGFL